MAWKSTRHAIDAPLRQHHDGITRRRGRAPLDSTGAPAAWDSETGVWVGVELDDPLGKNDGSAGTVRYFTCAENHGTFAKPTNVQCGDFPNELDDSDDDLDDNPTKTYVAHRLSANLFSRPSLESLVEKGIVRAPVEKMGDLLQRKLSRRPSVQELSLIHI